MGINMKEVTDKLQVDGIAAFAKALQTLYEAIRQKQTIEMVETIALRKNKRQQALPEGRMP